MNVQELAAALTGDRVHVERTLLLDPPTGAVPTLERLLAPVDDLFVAEAAWPPAPAR
ncbi:MAG TPA: hypothetical protein VFL91_30510 [Thermomicrobiales bacterium]|nr:hypothetical protein [Thermomicrobiales bacterium]